jgi:hypothetical protein
VIQAKTVCAVARQQRPPEFIASMRDRDTDSATFAASWSR